MCVSVCTWGGAKQCRRPKEVVARWNDGCEWSIPGYKVSDLLASHAEDDGSAVKKKAMFEGVHRSVGTLLKQNSLAPGNEMRNGRGPSARSNLDVLFYLVSF